MGTQTTDMAAAKRSGPTPPPVDPVLRQTFATNLRAARLSAKLTQQALADRSGLSREYIGQAENGTANVSLDVVSMLAASLGRTPFWLLTPKTTRKA